MPRRARQAPGGVICHVLNRAAGRRRLSDDEEDCQTFLIASGRALSRPAGARSPGPVRVPGYCLMPDHRHLVLGPRGEGDLPALLFRLTMTHTRRWRHSRRTVGEGPPYQGRFKCFPIRVGGSDGASHFRTACRYVQRNPLRAGMVCRAGDWRYSRSHARPNPAGAAARLIRLDPWPAEEPADWLARVNGPQAAKELKALRASARRGRPFGGEAWQREVAAEPGPGHTLRPPGRSGKPRPDARPTELPTTPAR